MQTAPTQKRVLYVHFESSPIGYHVFREGRKHPVGYLKTVKGFHMDYLVIHNQLSAAEQSVPRPLDEAKKLITDLINGRC
tara:strand:- start:1027 stop:1266 length:240 start_codon:yes stop_codon:yes gene_type:complete